jgi:histidyl-tRNA synthetase
MPFKRYQVAPVWRAEKPARGRFREFLQCDVDIVGEASVRADAECMMVGLEVLAALGVPGFVMRVNNRKILDGLLERVGVPDRSRHADVLRAVDKLPKIGRAGVVAELEAVAGLDAEQVARLFEVLELEVTRVEHLPALAALFEGVPSGMRGVAELTELLEIVAAAGYRDAVEIDLSIARGLDYYTGTIYETFVSGREEFGSVMSGGRYDELLGMFLKQSIPAVGISLGVDRLLSILSEMGLVTSRPSVADVYLALLDDGGFGAMAAIGRRLRRAGLKVEVAMDAKRLGKQLKAAQRRGHRWVLLAGPEERAGGRVAVKDLETGDQVELPEVDAAAWLLERVRG